jgi:hypothetical protein
MSYAVVWSTGSDIHSGSLEAGSDQLVLDGRDRSHVVLFSAVVGAWIARGPADRLRGLPALVLALRDGSTLRIASLEGAGVLHEVAQAYATGRNAISAVPLGVDSTVSVPASSPRRSRIPTSPRASART